MIHIKPINRSALAFAAIFLLTACATTFQTGSSGKVLDQASLLPIDDAIVIATWWGSKSFALHPASVCAYVKTTKTDANGKYSIHPWVGSVESGPIHNVSQEYHVYKPGYTYSGYGTNYKPDYLYMEKFAGNTQERLEYLRGVIGEASCGDDENQRQETIDLFREIYLEALMITDNDENNDVLKDIRYLMTIPWSNTSKSLLPEEAEMVFDKRIRPLL